MQLKSENYQKKWRHPSKIPNSSSDEADDVMINQASDDIVPNMNLTLSLDIEKDGVRTAHRNNRPSVTQANQRAKPFFGRKTYNFNQNIINTSYRGKKTVRSHILTSNGSKSDDEDAVQIAQTNPTSPLYHAQDF